MSHPALGSHWRCAVSEVYVDLSIPSLSKSSFFFACPEIVFVLSSLRDPEQSFMYRSLKKNTCLEFSSICSAEELHIRVHIS